MYLCQANILQNLMIFPYVSIKVYIKYTDDYYTLKKEPYNPVLPTYEEVVFLDKNDLANIHLNGKHFKPVCNKNLFL